MRSPRLLALAPVAGALLAAGCGGSGSSNQPSATPSPGPNGGVAATPAQTPAQRPAQAAPSATPATASGQVGVSLAEYSITPSVTQSPAGRVTFTVKNGGGITHEFVVIKTDQPAASLPQKGSAADEAGNVGETGEITPGQTKKVTLRLKAGHYALICNLPGHYAAGQHVDFTVQ